MLLKGKNFAYMNFDDERLANFDPGQILPSFYEVHGKNFDFIFLDEIQNLDKWELLVNHLNRIGFNVLITGSNAKLLSKELASRLTGRHITIELLPFSFREYLNAAGFRENLQTTRGISLLKHELKKYIALGGFPEIIAENEEPKIYIRELYRKIIERDIVSRYNITYKKTFRDISITLLSNPGRSISYNKIKNQFGLGSEHTAKNYLSYLEEAYMIFLLSRFSYRPVEIEKSDKKVYAIDTGLINSLSFKSTEDYGHVYENMVAIELLRRKSFNPLIELYYWKNIKHEEVDFVIKEGLKVRQLIQVCYSISDIETKKRELKGLVGACKELKLKKGIVITEDFEGREKRKGIEIVYMPLWRWLLRAA